MSTVMDNKDKNAEYYATSTDEKYVNDEVGEDPKYSDKYIFVKTEIDKLSNTDYSEISRVCEEILINQSKDLRVAGYLVLSKTYTDGIDGLIEASEIYLFLIDKYGILLHPKRENARLQAFAWLNNDKLIVFFEKYTLNNNVGLAKLTKLRNTIQEINKKAVNAFGHEITPWTILNCNLDQKIEHLSLQNSQQNISVAKEKDESYEKKKISSDIGVTKYCSDIVEYLHNSEQWLSAIAISRALKWTSLVLPVSENGCTKIPAPRDVVKSHVTGVIIADDYKQQLTNLEQFFLEPGCQYWIDLQYEAQESAKKLNRNDVADLIEKLTVRLLKEQPELQRLTFADGTPFASGKTRQWIKAVVNEHATSNVDTEVAENVDSFRTQLDKIKRESFSNDIEVSLKRVSEIRISSVSEKFNADLARLEICISNDRSDLALHLAESLNQKVNKYKLAEWEPLLAVEVWSHIRDLLVQKQPDKELLKRIKRLEGKICDLDIAVALNYS